MLSKISNTPQSNDAQVGEGAFLPLSHLHNKNSKINGQTKEGNGVAEKGEGKKTIAATVSSFHGRGKKTRRTRGPGRELY